MVRLWKVSSGQFGDTVTSKVHFLQKGNLGFTLPEIGS